MVRPAVDDAQVATRVARFVVGQIEVEAQVEPELLEIGDRRIARHEHVIADIERDYGSRHRGDAAHDRDNQQAPAEKTWGHRARLQVLHITWPTRPRKLPCRSAACRYSGRAGGSTRRLHTARSHARSSQPIAR